MITPRLTFHARERCHEMGIRTKRVKQIVRLPDVDYAANGDDDLRICYRYGDDIAVCYAPQKPPVVVSVLWHTQEMYERAK